MCCARGLAGETACFWKREREPDEERDRDGDRERERERLRQSDWENMERAIERWRLGLHEIENIWVCLQQLQNSCMSYVCLQVSVSPCVSVCVFLWQYVTPTGTYCVPVDMRCPDIPVTLEPRCATAFLQHGRHIVRRACASWNIRMPYVCFQTRIGFSTWLAPFVISLRCVWSVDCRGFVSCVPCVNVLSCEWCFCVVYWNWHLGLSVLFSYWKLRFPKQVNLVSFCGACEMITLWEFRSLRVTFVCLGRWNQ